MSLGQFELSFPSKENRKAETLRGKKEERSVTSGEEREDEARARERS